MRHLRPARAFRGTVPANLYEVKMISSDLRAQIRHWFYAEHWKIGTIAQELGLHANTVRHALETDQFNRRKVLRPLATDPYVEFLQQTLQNHPRLRATRIYHMIRERGYAGSLSQLRRVVARLRPPRREAFLRLRMYPAEQAQADWVHFGEVAVGRARRRLSCFLITLSYSRALYLEFFFDQTTENFLRGHVRAFAAWAGVPRIVLYGNLKLHSIDSRRQGFCVRGVIHHSLLPSRRYFCSAYCLPFAFLLLKITVNTVLRVTARLIPSLQHLANGDRPSLVGTGACTPNTGTCP
jgi:hypothetical protein